MKNYGRKSNWVRGNCIGKGSFGVVNIGVDESDGVMFAVKSVEKNSGEFVGCLENEIRILKSLSSPYIVRYLRDDVTCEYSSVYRNLHMEYMPGGTVADVAKHGGGVNLRSYTRCITSALSYIHAKGIVHCDVKGKNVLIGNNPSTAKLADFGSAIELGSPVTGTRGSPLWMAPEVIRGEYQGPESDVWSLGCTVIEILTGKPAWQDRGADTFRQIGYSDELPEITVPLPEDLRDFLNKCLRRERSERWSCDQLLHHPFLLSCSPPSPQPFTIDTCKFSPRCVFDWSASSSSNESTLEIYQFDMKNLEPKQRISKLASNSGANWESEGWEMVRHATTLEYSDSSDYEESVSGNGRAIWEYTESNASYIYDLERTTNDARGTTAGSIYKDTVIQLVYICIDKKIVTNIFLYIELYPTDLLYALVVFLSRSRKVYHHLTLKLKKHYNNVCYKKCYDYTFLIKKNLNGRRYTNHYASSHLPFLGGGDGWVMIWHTFEPIVTGYVYC